MSWHRGRAKVHMPCGDLIVGGEMDDKKAISSPTVEGGLDGVSNAEPREAFSLSPSNLLPEVCRQVRSDQTSSNTDCTSHSKELFFSEALPMWDKLDGLIWVVHRGSLGPRIHITCPKRSIELSHGFRFRNPSAVFCIHFDHGLRFEFDPCIAEVTCAVEKAARRLCPTMSHYFDFIRAHCLPVSNAWGYIAPRRNSRDMEGERDRESLREGAL